MKLYGIPGVARVVITLARIILLMQIKTRYMEIASTLLMLAKYKAIFQYNLQGGISGIARVMITLWRVMFLMKIRNNVYGNDTPIITVSKPSEESPIWFLMIVYML